MKKEDQQDIALDGLIKELQVFIELSFQEDETSLNDWINETINKLESRCWKSKNCEEDNCPAYKNECGRCWLIAGTMCGGKAQGKFVEKYGFCTECKIFKDSIGDDRVRCLREFVIVLIHSLRLKQQELKEAASEIKTLSGFLPICASCKSIRDDKGCWKKIELYISDHSQAEFSHSICPDCAKRIYPDLTDENGSFCNTSTLDHEKPES